MRAFRGEAQDRWFEGMESAFRAFGGVPEEVLFDNARALVERHDAGTRALPHTALSTCWAEVAMGRDEDGVLVATPQRRRP